MKATPKMRGSRANKLGKFLGGKKKRYTQNAVWVHLQQRERKKRSTPPFFSALFFLRRRDSRVMSPTARLLRNFALFLLTGNLETRPSFWCRTWRPYMLFTRPPLRQRRPVHVSEHNEGDARSRDKKDQVCYVAQPGRRKHVTQKKVAVSQPTSLWALSRTALLHISGRSAGVDPNSIESRVGYRLEMRGERGESATQAFDRSETQWRG